MDFMIAGVAEPPNLALNFTPFQFHGLWLEVIMTPPAAPKFLDVVGNGGRGHVVVGQPHGDAGGGDYFSDGASECGRIGNECRSR